MFIFVQNTGIGLYNASDLDIYDSIFSFGQFKDYRLESLVSLADFGGVCAVEAPEGGFSPGDFYGGLASPLFPQKSPHCSPGLVVLHKHWFIQLPLFFLDAF
jgi:hypothetical protein